MSYFTDAIEKNPKNPTYYVFRAITHLAAKKDKEALKDALQIVQCNPNWPKVKKMETMLISR